MSGRRLSRIITGGIAASCLCAAAVLAQQFISFSDRTRAILEGNWQSCREADGMYAERVYDAKLPGGETFELHMGPFREFALFRGIQDDHREHSSADNLLSRTTSRSSAIARAKSGMSRGSISTSGWRRIGRRLRKLVRDPETLWPDSNNN